MVAETASLQMFTWHPSHNHTKPAYENSSFYPKAVFLNYALFICVCVLARSSSVLPPCGVQEYNSGHQAWWRGSLSIEPSHTYMHVYTCHSTCVEVWEQRSGVLFYHVGSRDQIQVVKLGAKYLYLLSHFKSYLNILKKKNWTICHSVPCSQT